MKSTILNTTYNLSLLAELGKPETVQPDVDRLIHALYSNIFGTVVSNELETENTEIKTRIYGDKKDERGILKETILKKDQKIVISDVIRAGIQASHLFYIKLTEILNPSFVRQDHIMAQRIEGENGVEGASLMGSKIGGRIEDAIVFLPDPMGATGNSMKEVIEHYQKNYGIPKKFVIVNLVITPEYLECLEKVDANISVYAARLDKGLTETDYIYPGLGGVGEMINNTEK